LKARYIFAYTFKEEEDRFLDGKEERNEQGYKGRGRRVEEIAFV